MQVKVPEAAPERRTLPPSSEAGTTLKCTKPRGRMLGGWMRICRIRLRMMFGPPLSRLWGMDRGTPAHRHYIDLFLEQHRDDISGRCLEFQEPLYLSRFGEAIEHIDILHVDDSNPNATVIADITKPNSIPDETYDCIICTHVLHVIYDFEAAIETLWRILKPGGVLLIASPLNSMCDESQGELWRFTRLGLQRILSKHFGKTNVNAVGYGNSIVSAGELRGMTAEEFTTRELYTHDPCAASEICARAVKRVTRRSQRNTPSRIRSLTGSWMTDLAILCGQAPLYASRYFTDASLVI